MKPMSKRYFSDYEVQTVVDENGRLVKKLHYIGNTYTALLPEAAYKRRKVRFALLSLGCAALFLWANCQNTSSNRGGALAALGIVMVIPVFLMCYASVVSLWKRQTMTRFDYIETSMLLKFGGFFSAALGGAIAVWHGIYSMRHGLQEELAREVMVTCAWAALTVFSICLWVPEVRTEYRVRNREGSIIHREHFKRKG